jgi:hypothetical protein
LIEDGAVIVPEEAVGLLAAEGLRFTVEGQARYEQMAPSIHAGRTSAQE